MTDRERQRNGHTLSSFVSNYKPKCYYWKYTIFIRRIRIAMFSVSAPSTNFKIEFILIIFIFLFIQYKCEPFIINSVNTMEFILLSCFIFAIVLASEVHINERVKQLLILFLIIFPFILFIYFIVKYQKRKFDEDSKCLKMTKITSDYHLMDDKDDE